MKIHTNRLDINKFKEDFDTLYSGEHKEQILNINQLDYSISSFLRKVDLIENEDIQKSCRHAAIAQMYNADLEHRGARAYVETPSYGEIVLIQVPINTGFPPVFSTVILSKYGDILINEGEIKTHSGRNYGIGFTVKKIIDGQVSTKYGFIDNAGARVLPCVFDYIKQGIGRFDIYFGQLRFCLNRYGNKDSIDRDKLQKLIDYYDYFDFICISEDAILFSLETIGDLEMPESIQAQMAIENNGHISRNVNDLMEELRTSLSPILVSKEKLQEIMESNMESGKSVCRRLWNRIWNRK
jgi:hypothetical protein